ncbi:hypothetical protein PRUPE_5G064400 [Prunus persica]|uniref:Uncharacterized protein n=1 Tax=Prunus persica TaxID=3760 RepID=A0A251P4M1_PRUPE|nr:hypothetical protein PRUPE_5G064400 [Prunus persica]
MSSMPPLQPPSLPNQIPTTRTHTQNNPTKPKIQVDLGTNLNSPPPKLHLLYNPIKLSPQGEQQARRGRD